MSQSSFDLRGREADVAPDAYRIASPGLIRAKVEANRPGDRVPGRRFDNNLYPEEAIRARPGR